MGRDIVMQQEPTARRLQLWPHAVNALQEFSENIKLENTADSLLSGTDSLFVKHRDQHGLILDLCKRNILDLGNDFQVYCML
jgi:hypothetical protein